MAAKDKGSKETKKPKKGEKPKFEKGVNPFGPGGAFEKKGKKKK